MTWIEVARVIACALVVLAAGRFCFLYHRRTGGKWRSNPYGVHMMVFSGAFVGYFAYAIVSLLFLPPEWRPLPGAILILSIAGLFVWRTRLLDVAQREPVKPEESHEEG